MYNTRLIKLQDELIVMLNSKIKDLEEIISIQSEIIDNYSNMVKDENEKLKHLKLIIDNTKPSGDQNAATEKTPD